MTRTIAAALAMLSIAVPAFAKTKKVHAVRGVYPVSCDDLWVAVKNTLGNGSNYGLSGVNDIKKTASFVVIGAVFMSPGRVALIQKGAGCQMNTQVRDVGPENTNYHQFRGRVERSLSKRQAASMTGAPRSPGSAKRPVGPN